MGDKKNVLLIRSSFPGAEEVLSGLEKRTRDVFDFCELGYRDMDSYRDEGVPVKYDAKRFYFREGILEEDEETVNSSVFGDLIRYIGNNYDFRKQGRRVSCNGVTENKEAIETVAGLVYREIDVVLPIWSEKVEDGRFEMIANQYLFFSRLRDGVKGKLHVSSSSVERVGMSGESLLGLE